jgi:4-amino-4-deoxy-L-arabinose transferase-like glycosyltransferase
MTSLLDTRRPRLLLTLLCALLWAPGFWTLPPTDRDESRFAQATKQMLETGDFVRIMNGAEARNRKPIGIHWLQAPFAAAAQSLGVATENPIWPYRIPSALGALAAVLACFELGVLLVGRRAALLGAGMLAASTLLVAEVHIAKTDAALLGATTVAMAILGRAYLDPRGVGRRQAAVFWLAMGAGVLLKGPITPLVAGLCVAALLAADGRIRQGGAEQQRANWLRCLRPAWGAPLMLAVVLPWFVTIGVATEGRFFSDAVGGDLGHKLTSGDDAHWGPPGMHLALLPLLLFPAVAALPGAVALAWRERRSAPMRFLLAWIVPAWLVFEATPTKLPHYLLPLYPALCLVMALAVLQGDAARWRRSGAWLAGLGAAGLTVIALAAPVALRMAWWVGLPAAAGVLATGWFAVRAWRPGAAVGALGAAALLYAGMLGYGATALTPLWVTPRVLAALQAAGLRPMNPASPAGPGAPPTGRLGAIGFAEPSLLFLAGSNTLWLHPNAGPQALMDGTVDILMVGDRDIAAARRDLAAHGATVREIGAIMGFNYSRGRWITLTLLVRD